MEKTTKKKTKKKKGLGTKSKALYKPFIEWYATPPHLRPDDQQTIAQWSQVHNVTPSTAYSIKKQPKFAGDCLAEYEKHKADRLLTVRQKLYDMIMVHGEAKAIKLFFEYEEKWSQKITAEMSYDPKTIGEAMLLAKESLKKESGEE